MIPVLCINDSSINLFVQKKLLLQSGITDNVITVADGQEALDYYSRFKDLPSFEYPRLILLDIHMPRVDGWEFLDKFSELYLSSFDETRVIVNSFTVDENEINKAKNYPLIIDFVTTQLTTEYFRQLELPGSKEMIPGMESAGTHQ
ncbi:response regulator [Daejeonella sp.]|uniref:response regulator n=1 Tax=Daejeonella sp. TaxID=2805397 RepID=UPI003982F5DB